TRTPRPMIDYFALALGHGLLAIALLRLVMRRGLDEDPLIEAIRKEAASGRKAASAAGRSAARRERGGAAADAAAVREDP
ncbi:MAG: hypothetical protein ACKO01_05290, partial [Erythrobacter sp.]